MIPKNDRESKLIEYGIKVGGEHCSPSQETLNLIKGLAEDNKKQWETIGKMQTKIDEIHTAFVGTKFTARAIITVFASIGIISGGVFAFIKLMKAMLK